MVNPEDIVYENNGVAIVMYWPRSPYSKFLKNDEAEVLVFNEGKVFLAFTDTSIRYLVDDREQKEYSGTWEVFPSILSWDRIVYENIGKSYYSGRPLTIGAGQKGKIHYHYEMIPLREDHDQRVSINLLFDAGGEAISVQKELTRIAELLGSPGENEDRD